MLKNKNNFEIINSFFHCQAENFSDHPTPLSDAFLAYTGTDLLYLGWLAQLRHLSYFYHFTHQGYGKTYFDHGIKINTVESLKGGYVEK